MTASRSTLGEVAEFINGAAFKPEDWTEAGQPIIRIQNLTDPSKPFNRTTRTVASKYQVDPGDLLVSWSATLGVFEWNRAEAGLLNQHIFRVLPDPKKIRKDYLRHMLHDALFEMERHMHGATMKHVNRGEFLATTIPLPPLAEQKRIAGILDAADGLRAKRRESLAQLDSLLQSTFLTLFGDPVANPMGWEKRKFGEIGSLDRGVSKHRPRNAPELLGGAYPLIQTGEVANCDTFIREYKNTYSEAGLKQSKLWPAGTLCITIAANIAKTGILEFDACFPDSIVGFRSSDPATVFFAQVWLSFLQKMLEETAPESAQKNINLEILRNLEVPLPPLPLQRRFAAIVESVERQKARQRAHLAELDALFAALQHRAFRGEL
jgi:type I restriction enzyme S subunit